MLLKAVWFWIRFTGVEAENSFWFSNDDGNLNDTMVLNSQSMAFTWVSTQKSINYICIFIALSNADVDNINEKYQ